jgi:tetratricopeptide (TPR) repeat protein
MKIQSLLFAAVMLLSSSARAGEAPGDAQQREARQHYERGMTHYQLGEFNKAVEEFKQAYALQPAPGLLFNLAQASRLGKQYERAIYFYRTYLRVNPEAPNRIDVEARIAELEPLAAADEKRKLAADDRNREPASAPTTAVGGAPAPAAARDGRGLKIGGIVVGAVGLAALGVGIGLSVDMMNAQNQLEKLRRDGGAWSQAQADLYDRGRTEATASTALYAVGGAAVGTGIILYLVGRHYDRGRRYALAPPPARMESAGWAF